MNTYMKTNVLCLGLLGALSLTACSNDTVASQNFGTTEEKNAFWDQISDLSAWNVMDGSDIKLDANKKTLAGRVALAKTSGNDLSRAGIFFDATDEEGAPVDLSESSGGLCIAYSSELNVEVRLDDEKYESSSIDKDLPYASFNKKKNGQETQCVSWKEFKKKKSDVGDDSFAKKVNSVQIVFVGKSGASGEFDIQRFEPYVRWDMWIGKDGEDHVKTGFEEGDEGTSGELSLFGDSSEAYVELDHSNKFSSLDEIIEYNEGLYGNVVFENSSSNPDVGIQFLVAGKSTEKGKEVIHSADVTTKWKGLCLEYESEMDIEISLVSKEKSLKTTFAKNDDLETKCVEFENLQNSDAVLKKLTTVRMKFVKENKSGTQFRIRRISYLLPEDSAVRDIGENKDVTPTTTSDYKSGKSFLWNGATDGNHVNTGIGNATTGGNWFNSATGNGDYHMILPDDVEADDNGNAIPSLVSKHHKLTAYVKTEDGLTDLADVASIGFNTVSSNQEPADISAWGGFCIHYKTDSYVRIAIVTNYAQNKYWYADVEYSNNMVWGKVSWDAFKNIDEKSKEKIEDVIGEVTMVQLLFPMDGEFFIDKFGSYDQCGN